MNTSEIRDPLFRQAVSALDAGDVPALERLLEEHPRLAHDRLDGGQGYFLRPYLLWFVAENPVRNGRLPENIVTVTRTILRAVQREGGDTLSEQLRYALALVCTGRVARECGQQLELIDLFIDAGAAPDALHGALAHRELAAARRLLERGAAWTLVAAVCLGKKEGIVSLAAAAGPEQRQMALATAALYGRAEALTLLIDLGVDVNAYSPDGFHPHATALHQAVDSDSLEAVRVLVEAGARLEVRDRVHRGTPLDWAEYLQRREIAAYLREKGKPA